MEISTLMDKLARAIAGDTKAKREITDELARQDAEQAAKAKAEAEEAARLEEKRKRDKYELLPATRTGKYGAFQQIRAIKDIRPGIPAGTLGGYVGSEANLDQTGTCWINDGAVVKGSARITEDATIHPGCEIAGRAQVSGSAELYSCIVKDDAMVSGSAELRYCNISGGATITDQVKGYRANIGGVAYIGEKFQLWGDGPVITVDGGRLTGEAAYSTLHGGFVQLLPSGKLPFVEEAERSAKFSRDLEENRRRAAAEAAERQRKEAEKQEAYARALENAATARRAVVVKPIQ